MTKNLTFIRHFVLRKYFNEKYPNPEKNEKGDKKFLKNELRKKFLILTGQKAHAFYDFYGELKTYGFILDEGNYEYFRFNEKKTDTYEKVFPTLQKESEQLFIGFLERLKLLGED